MLMHKNHTTCHMNNTHRRYCLPPPAYAAPDPARPIPIGLKPTPVEGLGCNEEGCEAPAPQISVLPAARRDSRIRLFSRRLGGEIVRSQKIEAFDSVVRVTRK